MTVLFYVLDCKTQLHKNLRYKLLSKTIVTEVIDLGNIK